MGFLERAIKEKFDEEKPDALKADIRMISGCDDHQTSADVSNVSNYRIPDVAGRAGGACTSTLLHILYEDHKTPADTMSFVEVLEKAREHLKSRGFEQIPQLSASHTIDVNHDFDLVPPETTGTRRAVMIGINYIGHDQGVLSGCHNDCMNMKEYIKDVHGFEEDNIQVLMDDGEHLAPTHENIMAAYRKIIAESEPGDALFLHYSGHGCAIKDDEKEEADGKDEALVPVDYIQNGLIRDDELYDTIVKPLAKDIHLVALMDCCHSGTILDLPYIYKANGQYSQMEIDDNFDFKKLMGKFGKMALSSAFEQLRK